MQTRLVIYVHGTYILRQGDRECEVPLRQVHSWPVIIMHAIAVILARYLWKRAHRCKHSLTQGLIMTTYHLTASANNEMKVKGLYAAFEWYQL